ncbi:hypothetical protein C0J52_16038 [Blattella germanica]|nr:hypothetical protein C0J52_16038 [Blattella germanica]
MQNQMQAIAARNPPVEQVLQNDARQVQLHGRVTYPVGPMPRFTEADQHFLRCVACGHPARFMCSACHLASYCTSKCQYLQRIPSRLRPGRARTGTILYCSLSAAIHSEVDIP